jgi:RNA-directed DNA polymerase
MKLPHRRHFPRLAASAEGGIFLHYGFDVWMARTFAHIPFERYADDIICQGPSST